MLWKTNFWPHDLGFEALVFVCSRLSFDYTKFSRTKIFLSCKWFVLKVHKPKQKFETLQPNNVRNFTSFSTRKIVLGSFLENINFNTQQDLHHLPSFPPPSKKGEKVHDTKHSTCYKATRQPHTHTQQTPPPPSLFLSSHNPLEEETFWEFSFLWRKICFEAILRWRRREITSKTFMSLMKKGIVASWTFQRGNVSRCGSRVWCMRL